jgi:hypothetical protein
MRTTLDRPQPAATLYTCFERTQLSSHKLTREEAP